MPIFFLKEKREEAIQNVVYLVSQGLGKLPPRQPAISRQSKDGLVRSEFHFSRSQSPSRLDRKKSELAPSHLEKKASCRV